MQYFGYCKICEDYVFYTKTELDFHKENISHYKSEHPQEPIDRPFMKRDTLSVETKENMISNVWQGVNTFHKSASCAERNKPEGFANSIPLEQAIFDDLTPCGICFVEYA